VAAGLAIGGVVILARLLWTFPGAYLPHLLSSAVSRREGGMPTWRNVLLVSWCGMRGVISLAAALALPRGGEGAPGFPGRDLIIFLTIMVIIATLVVQGLTLLPLVRLLGIRDDDSGEAELRRAREAALEAGIARLDAYCSEVSCPVAVHHLREAMADRLASFRAEDGAERAIAAQRLAVSEEVHEAVRGAQSSRLLALRDSGDINDNTYLELLLEVDRGALA
jgi:CPA1 family monovalent cation:H+ antiporter